MTIETENNTAALPIPMSRFWKMICVFIVATAPIIWFSFIYLSFKVERPWQSGDISTFSFLSMMPNVSWPFFPLLIYPTICLAFLLSNPTKYKDFWWSRFGVYTGTLLTLQYSVQIFVWYFYNIFLLLFIWLLPIALVGGYKVLYPVLLKKWGRDTIEKISFIFLALVIFGIGIGIIFIVIYSAFFWAFLIMGATSYWLFVNYETKLGHERKWWLFLWFLYYIFAWRLNYIIMLGLYSNLPSVPPPPLS